MVKNQKSTGYRSKNRGSTQQNRNSNKKRSQTKIAQRFEKGTRKYSATNQKKKSDPKRKTPSIDSIRNNRIRLYILIGLFILPIGITLFILEYFNVFNKYSGVNDSLRRQMPDTEKESRWKYIVLHHSATTMANLERINRNHLEEGYNEGCAYHFVINNGYPNPDGQIEESYRWQNQISGAHVEKHTDEYNTKGIGVCVVGDFTRQEITDEQYKSLKMLVISLMEDYNIPFDRIVLHRDINQTICPGPNFPSDRLIEDIKEYIPEYRNMLISGFTN